MKINKKLRALAFLMSFIFVVSSFLMTAYAEEVNNNNLKISKGWFGCEGKWIYQKNNDNENAITLVKCNTAGRTELISTIDSYDVTRMGDNFYVVRAVDYTESIFECILVFFCR